jgi:hypothetical protein
MTFPHWATLLTLFLAVLVAMLLSPLALKVSGGKIGGL